MMACPGGLAGVVGVKPPGPVSASWWPRREFRCRGGVPPPTPRPPRRDPDGRPPPAPPEVTPPPPEVDELPTGWRAVVPDLRPLRHADYRRLILGQSVSFLGSMVT